MAVDEAPAKSSETLGIFKRVLDRKVSEASSHLSPKKVDQPLANPFVTFGSSGIFSDQEKELLTQVYELNKADSEDVGPKKKKK